VPDTLPICIATSHDPDQGRCRQPGAGLTVQDAARRYRVSPDKIRAWIARGELRAINTSTAKCGRPRFVIPPEALEEFERSRSAGPAPKAKRRPRRPELVDYWPGD
jgi:excisionase family DNA binding protein